MFLLEWFASNTIGKYLKQFLPWIIGIGLILGGVFFLYSYLENMKATVESNKAIIASLQEQNTQIKAANEVLASDIKSIKELNDTFNVQLTNIRANANALSNVVNSSKFKTQVTSNVKDSQNQLNKSFNDYFDKLNTATKGVQNGK
jgi:predicted DNA repair protein MutK